MIRDDRPANRTEEIEIDPAILSRALGLLRFHVAEDRLINVDQEALVRDLYFAMTSDRAE